MLYLPMVVAFELCVTICLPIVLPHTDTGIVNANTERVVHPRLAKRIISIRPETGEQGFKVHIIADGRLKDYNSSRLSRPHRVVIDLPGVQCSLKQKTLLVDSLLVKSIHVDTSCKDKIRVVFDLFHIARLPYKVFPQGNQLIVAFGSVAGSPVLKNAEEIQQVPPVNAPEKKKEEVKGGDGQKAAPTAASKITAIEAQTDEQGIKVDIVTDGKPTRYNALQFYQPTQLVVTLFGVKSTVGKKKLLLSDPLLKGIRLNTSYKGQVRVVLDIASPGIPPYQILPKDDRLVVFIKHPSGLSPTKTVGKAKPALLSTTNQRKAASAPAELARKESSAAISSREVVLHISSFKRKINAEKEVKRIGKHGYKTFLAEEEVSGERWFRVYIVGFKDEQEARKVGSELKRKGLISYFKLTKIDQGVIEKYPEENG